MKTKTTRRRLYSYSVVAYFQSSSEVGGPLTPMAWPFPSTSIAAARRKAGRLGFDVRRVMTSRAAAKILAAPPGTRAKFHPERIH